MKSWTASMACLKAPCLHAASRAEPAVSRQLSAPSALTCCASFPSELFSLPAQRTHACLRSRMDACTLVEPETAQAELNMSGEGLAATACLQQEESCGPAWHAAIRPCSAAVSSHCKQLAEPAWATCACAWLQGVHPKNHLPARLAPAVRGGPQTSCHLLVKKTNTVLSLSFDCNRI